MHQMGATVSTNVPTVEESITLAAHYEISFADRNGFSFHQELSPFSGTVLLGNFVLLRQYNVAASAW